MSSTTTAVAIPFATSRDTPVQRLISDAFAGSRFLCVNAALLFAGFTVCLILQQLDGRLFQGVNVWDKPSKFFLSLAVHLFTVAWAASLLPETARKSLGVVWASRGLASAAWLELAYIVFRAAQGEASHFNVGTSLNAALYALMGAGALTLTATTAVTGFALWRSRDGDLWREAAGFGLMLGAVLGTLAGGYMSSQTGHWVGGDMTDATGLPVFNWSTTGGDLRVAHFTGLHAVQFVPLAALSGRKSIVYATATVVILLAGAAFLQAVAGIPLLRAN